MFWRRPNADEKLFRLRFTYKVVCWHVVSVHGRYKVDTGCLIAFGCGVTQSP